MESEIDALLLEQDNAIRTISRTIINLKKMNTKARTIAVYQNRNMILENNWTKVNLLHVKIQELCKDKDKTEIPYYAADHFEDAEIDYLEAADYISEEIAALEPTRTVSTSAANDCIPGERVRTVKLPTIDLPSFAGDYSAWESFKDQFEALVIKNPTLSPVQWLQYLKASLTDEAGLLLKNVSITAANFDSAWASLEARYGNSRAIVNAHLRNFFSQSMVGNEVLRDLKCLRDTSNDVISALRNKRRPVDRWDDLLVYFIVSKLDKQSRKEWESALGDAAEYPDYGTLQKFLNVRIRTLEALAPAAGNPSSNASGKPKTQKPNETKSNVATSAAKCLACPANHPLHQCEVFRGKSVVDRQAFVRERKCCFNCLKLGHFPRECSSKNVCRTCKRKHHTLIHSETNAGTTPAATNAQGAREATPNTTTQNNVNSSEAQPHTSSVLSCFASERKVEGQSVILATAWARVKTTSGRSIKVRILLDQGSQSSFITESIAQALRAPRQRVATTISGLSGEPVGIAKTIARLTVEPCKPGGPVVPINALVLKKLTAYEPVSLNKQNSWEHLRGLELADSYSSRQESIQMLIGADKYGAILLDGLRKGPANAPIAQNTIFGWVVSGPTNALTQSHNLNVLHAHSYRDLDVALRAFWEVEELPRKPLLSEEDSRCEHHFATTHTRTQEGRYVVRLPFKTDAPISLGDSKNTAITSFYRLERRLARNSEQANAYKEFMLEYEDLGHMRAAETSEKSPPHEVYFPHHPVIRESSSTTKLRVVFNASSPTSNGTSLNDHLLVGPNLQGDLPSIILRWRSFRYVYMADMAKMFRQILVDRRDVDYQRVLWRSEPEKPLLAYQLLTVTYGTASAPFLANRVVRQLVIDEGNRFPLGVPVLKKNIYVDDVLFGADDMVLARQTKEQVTALLTAGGLHLRKWSSNCAELLNDIEMNGHERASDQPLQEGEGLKVLGILWSPREDAFRFKVNVSLESVATKRHILATIARIFDPLGWASPVVVSAKILMQTLWKLKCDWDDKLPENIQTE